jgi:hypothetical protein
MLRSHNYRIAHSICDQSCDSAEVIRRGVAFPGGIGDKGGCSIQTEMTGEEISSPGVSRRKRIGSSRSMNGSLAKADQNQSPKTTKIWKASPDLPLGHTCVKSDQSARNSDGKQQGQFGVAQRLSKKTTRE